MPLNDEALFELIQICSHCGDYCGKIDEHSGLPGLGCKSNYEKCSAVKKVYSQLL